jgi:hypothetical protein
MFTANTLYALKFNVLPSYFAKYMRLECMRAKHQISDKKNQRKR